MPSSSTEARAARLEAQYRSIRNTGDQEHVVKVLGQCAEAYATLGNAQKHSQYLYLLGKRQILRGTFTAALDTAELLVNSCPAESDPILYARALILRSAALRNQTQFVAAASSARQALEVLVSVKDGSELKVEAIQAIIAALVEADEIAEAWSLQEQLDSALTLIANASVAGHGYWTLGNLAYARGHLDIGLSYHDRAAELLQKAGDVHIWARFNKARADVQLQAGIADELTKDCISRAKLSYEITGCSISEFTDLAVTRARWHLAKKQPARAVQILEEALDAAGQEASFEDPAVHLFFAEILTTLGRHEEAKREHEYSARIQSNSAR